MVRRDRDAEQRQREGVGADAPVPADGGHHQQHGQRVHHDPLVPAQVARREVGHLGEVEAAEGGGGGHGGGEAEGDVGRCGPGGRRPPRRGASPRRSPRWPRRRRGRRPPASARNSVTVSVSSSGAPVAGAEDSVDGGEGSPVPPSRRGLRARDHPPQHAARHLERPLLLAHAGVEDEERPGDRGDRPLEDPELPLGGGHIAAPRRATARWRPRRAARRPSHAGRGPGRRRWRRGRRR